MKVLYVHDSKFIRYNDIYYGNGHYAYELQWKRYLEYFDEIRVVGRIKEVHNRSDVELVSVSSGPGVSFVNCPGLLSVKGLLFNIHKAHSILKEEIENADAVIIRMHSMSGSLAAMIARRKKVPYLVEVVGCSRTAFWYYGTLTGKLAALPSYRLEKYIIRHAPFAIYVSRNFLQQRYPNKHYSVGCPDCCVALTDSSVLENRIRRIDGYNDKTIYRLGFVGAANVEYKGLETALKALARLSVNDRNYRLCILGGGDYSRWIKKAEEYGIREMLEFSGIRGGGQEVFEWFDTIDIFIMPSFQETLGRALIEAMSRGCPALGTRDTAIPEQLGDDCLFYAGDEKMLEQLIRGMKESKEYMKMCARENFYRAQKYSEEILKPKRDRYWHDFIKYINDMIRR